MSFLLPELHPLNEKFLSTLLLPTSLYLLMTSHLGKKSVDFEITPCVWALGLGEIPTFPPRVSHEYVFSPVLSAHCWPLEVISKFQFSNLLPRMISRCKKYSICRLKESFYNRAHITLKSRIPTHIKFTNHHNNTI